MKNNLLVDEIFYSLQGEGPSAGQPSVFLRLAGCNLKCMWPCDTDANTDPILYVPVKSFPLSFDSIWKEILKYETENNNLIITGGEPLIQKQKIHDFLIYGFKNYYDYFLKLRIEIETNGTIDPLDNIDEYYISQYNVSIKLSSSKNKIKRRERPNIIKKYQSLIYPLIESDIIFKFVVANDKDLEEIKLLSERYRISKRSIWIMPEGVTKEKILEGAQKLSKICMKEGYNLSLRNQILLWGNIRGT